jgi:hypothetical protein
LFPINDLSQENKRKRKKNQKKPKKYLVNPKKVFTFAAEKKPTSD